MRLSSLARPITIATAAAALTTAFFWHVPQAAAQKAKDTLRVAATEPFKYVDPYYFPTPEGNFVTDAVFDGLLTYDANKKDYVSVIAKSWKRVDHVTLDFDLRD